MIVRGRFTMLRTIALAALVAAGAAFGPSSAVRAQSIPGSTPYSVTITAARTTAPAGAIAPGSTTNSVGARFTFATAGGFTPGNPTTFTCRLEGVGAFTSTVNGVACASGMTLPTFTQGTHTFEVRAQRGIDQDTDLFTWTVDTTAPTVALSAPAAGATVSGTVPVSATATDNTSVVNVRFRVNGTDLSPLDSSSPYSINWNTTTVANGTHTLSAVATDAAGNTRTSTVRTVTVVNPAVLTGASPPSGVQAQAPFTLTLTGSNFVAGATINGLSGNGVTFTTPTITATSITTTVTIAQTATVGTRNITVTNPGAVASAARPFTITAGDFTAPVLAQVTPVPTPSSDTTPTYTFSSTEAGTIAYGGGCTSPTTTATAGNNTVTFNALAAGTYGSCVIRVRDAAGNTSGSLSISSFTITSVPPAPTVTSFSPTTGQQGQQVAIALNGANYVAGSQVVVTPSTGVTVGPIVINPGGTTITTTLTLAANAPIGPRDVTVTHSGGTSAPRTFTIQAAPAAPVVLSINRADPTPTSAATVSWIVTFSVPVSGVDPTDFQLAPSGVTGAGNIQVSTGPSSTHTVTVSAGSGPGTLGLNVVDNDSITSGATPLGGAGAGNGNFTGQLYTINAVPPANNPVPATTSISPASVTVGSGTISMIVNGSNFMNGSIVRLDGVDRFTTFVSASQVRATILAGDMSAVGTRTVTVFNPTPGGGTSNGQIFTIAAAADTTAPTLAQVTAVPSPTTDTTPNYTFSSTEAGTILYGGDCGSTTTSAVAGNNTVTFSAMSVGVHSNCTIRVRDAAGNTSATLAVNTFTIDPVAPPPPPPGDTTPPAVQSVTGQPSSISALPATFVVNFTEPVKGLSASGIILGGTAGGTRSVQSVSPASGTASTFTVVVTGSATAGTITAQIATGAVQDVAGNANGASAVTGTVTFTVAPLANNSAPTTTGISPANKTAGDAGFTMTVNGSGFINSSTVEVNGSGRVTSFVSSTQLTVSIPASDMTSAGTRIVSVVNPTPGGGTSNGQPFTVAAAPPPPDPDTDGDGVLNSVDADASNPCIPNPNASTCSQGPSVIFGISANRPASVCDVRPNSPPSGSGSSGAPQTGFFASPLFCSENSFGGSSACGDGIRGPDEVCEIGDVITDTSSCDQECTDGGIRNFTCIQDATTGQCRFQNANDNNLASCIPFSCGNGTIDPGESCDDGALNGTHGHCGPDCSVAGSFFCGDGFLGGPEQCDCGTTTATRTATGSWALLNNCTVTNGQYRSGTGTSCDFDCTVPGPMCGDGLINGPEQCDGGFETYAGAFCNGGTNAGARCTTNADCAGATCGGTSLTNACPTAARICTSGPSTAIGTICTSNAQCGVGGVCSAQTFTTARTRTCNAPGTSSACEFSNFSVCKGGAQRCGNAVREGSEQCDDGNTENNDGCTNSCVTSSCGDGFVDRATEACDEGSNNGVTPSVIPYNGTSAFCTVDCQFRTVSGPFCGDNIKNGPEFCDGTDVGRRYCVVTATGDVNSSCTANTDCDTGETCREVGICNGGLLSGQTCDRTNATSCGTGGTCIAPICAPDCGSSCPFDFSVADLQVQSELQGSPLDDQVSLFSFQNNEGDVPDNATLFVPACSIGRAIRVDASKDDIILPRTDIIFVTDMSDSMTQAPGGGTATRPGRRIDVVASSARASIDQLAQTFGPTGDVRVGLVSFGTRFVENGSVVNDTDGFRQDIPLTSITNATSRNDVKTQLTQYSDEQHTASFAPMYRGVQQAVTMLDAAGRPGGAADVKIVIILSDGGITNNKTTIGNSDSCSGHSFTTGGVTYTDVNACFAEVFGELVRIPGNDDIQFFSAAISTSGSAIGRIAHVSSDTCGNAVTSRPDCTLNANVEYAYDGGTEAEIRAMYDQITKVITEATAAFVSSFNGQPLITAGVVPAGNNQTLPFPAGFRCQLTQQGLPLSFTFNGEGALGLSDFKFEYCPVR